MGVEVCSIVKSQQSLYSKTLVVLIRYKRRSKAKCVIYIIKSIVTFHRVIDIEYGCNGTLKKVSGTYKTIYSTV